MKLRQMLVSMLPKSSSEWVVAVMFIMLASVMVYHLHYGYLGHGIDGSKKDWYQRQQQHKQHTKRGV